ncbi:MAG TPA: DUF4160 domain-containing protein [Candidatus Latescibacteria bacterium]|nr:DUF4160 domain-containing protein [Candidatus Latescibacterota bacterium]HPC44556.1 DUF4160 domain-containing protein [Candidatus Latescibacterota bacterium]HQK22454.1 DUF4160 domain-containing protein [Candidatus Latescibacterota bacterium]HRS95558.1 DUF4160 domain-containing protein [Candidatus Latescibacterota bacterium]HRU23262.1 DUF4160 domain-containing protein [Candidatus Latescibacterota bacterium]
MPELSRFFGITVRMYYNDHEPPHFHVFYGDFEALIEVGSLHVFRGSLPRRAFAMVVEWAIIHREELVGAWQSARRGLAVPPIVPLD